MTEFNEFSVLLFELNSPNHSLAIGSKNYYFTQMHNPNIKIYQYLIIYIILFFLFTSKWSFELSRGWHFSYLVNSCRYCTVISIDVLWMSIPDENLTKCILLVQTGPQALIDYHTMLFPPPTSLIRQSMQERVDMIIIKVQSITNHFFMKGKQNISSLQKNVCSLVSLFLWYVMKVVALCKVSSVFNHIIPSFL